MNWIRVIFSFFKVCRQICPNMYVHRLIDKRLQLLKQELIRRLLTYWLRSANINIKTNLGNVFFFNASEDLRQNLFRNEIGADQKILIFSWTIFGRKFSVLYRTDAMSWYSRPLLGKCIKKHKILKNLNFSMILIYIFYQIFSIFRHKFIMFLL